MSQIYQARRKAGTAPAAKEFQTGVPGPSIRQLAAGAAPSADQMGSRVDLPGEIREKMESSFGADFSNVKLYESQTVADAGAQAVTQGSNIAFAPGQLDLTSTAGQALLGHELSHVVSQSRGESAGQGFLNDAGLEAQADRQGMMAAQGESAYSGPVSPIGASSAVSAAGPMQAKKAQKKANKALDEREKFSQKRDDAYEGAKARFMEKEGLDSYERKGSVASSEGAELYLKNALVGKSEEEQDKLIRLFHGGEEGSDEAILDYMAKDINRLTNKDFSGLASDSMSKRTEAFLDPDVELMLSLRDVVGGMGVDNYSALQDKMGGEEAMKAMQDKRFDVAMDDSSVSEGFMRLTGRNGREDSAWQQAYRRSRRKNRRNGMDSQQSGLNAAREANKVWGY